MIQLDIESILEGKKKGLSKRIPRFLINYLKRVVHQDELNEIFRRHGHVEGAEFAAEILDKFFHIKLIIEGEENLPSPEGRYTFACNHPLGGLDGVAIAAVIGKHYPNIKIMVNDLLMYVEPLAPIFIPVNKFGGQAKGAADTINDCYASDAQMVVFPSGKVSRKYKGVIKELEWKKSFINKTIKYKRDVVPIFFEGYNSNFFYNLATWRTRLGIKANIEMFYLPSEVFKKYNATFKIKIGKPIPWQTFDQSRTQTEWAKYVKDIAYSL